MVVQHLVGPAAFPALTNSISIISYNVLLPNSQDGWWTYKMYSPPLTDSTRHIAEWSYRKGLIQEQLAKVDADVVCLQEVSPLSFESDFDFMKELGYDCKEMFKKKSRFRPATFWKSHRLRLVTEPVHKDRTLITAFRLADDEDRKGLISFIVNCHLQAGPQGARRVRQIHEGIRGVVTLAKKLKVPDPLSVPLVVCGDFNSGDDCGATRYLEQGFVDETHVEEGAPVVSSGRKDLPLTHPMVDVSSWDRRTMSPPPTMVVAELISKLVKGGGNGYEDPELSSEVQLKLERIYSNLALSKRGEEQVMLVADVERFLQAINGVVGRGSEFREAARQMGFVQENDETPVVLPPDGCLTLPGFRAIYEKELQQGKFWGIAHDLAILGEPIHTDEMFVSRFDRIYVSQCITVAAVMDFASDKPCPNEVCPSDHLPIAALVSLN